MNPSAASAWAEGRRILWWVAAGLALGWLFGAPWAGLMLALAAHALHTVLRLATFERWLASRGRSALPDAGGGWGRVFHELLSQRRTERAELGRLKRQVKIVERVLRAFPDGILVLGRGNTIETCNAAAARHLNLRLPGDLGRPLTNLVRHPELVRFIEGRGELLECSPNGRGHERLMVRLMDFGGGQRNLLIIQDISQQERLRRMRQDFIANASHELKTPLTVITGDLDNLAQELQSKSTGGERGHGAALRRLREQTARMSTLVSDLLDLSGLESDESVDCEQVVAVRELLQRVAADTTAAGPRALIETTVEAQAPNLRGSAGELYNAFSNISRNSVLHGPPDVHIALSWSALPGAGGACFSVRDNGPGIPASELGRVTERFYRVDVEHSRRRGGTGLGLAIARHAVERHRGRLEILSLPQGGLEVRCVFPPEMTAPPGAPPDPRQSAETPGQIVFGELVPGVGEDLGRGADLDQASQVKIRGAL